MNAAALIIGVVILIGLTLWVGSFFGTNGPEYVIWGGMAVLLALAVWVSATGPTKPKIKSKAEPIKPIADPKRFHWRAPSREERKRLRDQ